jgi:hypothetical protein
MVSVDRLKGFFCNLPPAKLSPEQEEKLIERLAKLVVRYGMEPPALITLTAFKPISTITSLTVLFWIAPFLDIAGMHGYEYSLLFAKKENVERLINKIEELSKSPQSK